MTVTSAGTLSGSLERGGTTVEARDLVKTYGDHRALDGVSLTVGQGQVYGVLGPNGAGKTTLLRGILGLVRPERGSVTVLGHRPGSTAALRHTGALIESPAFVPGLSGRTNLAVLAQARGLGAAEADRVLRLVDLTGAARRPVKSYSMGMKQRLGVAAAILGAPRLLVLDEPTNGLDPEGVVAMRGLIRALAQDGATVLVSSHVLSEVEQTCDAVLVLRRGRVVAEGTVAELMGSPGTQAQLLVRAEPFARAEALLTGADFVSDVAPRDQDGRTVLACRVDEGDVPRVSDLLVRGGTTVHELTRSRRRLEDVFLDLTHEEGPR